MIRVKDHVWKLCTLTLFLFIIFQHSSPVISTPKSFWPASLVCPAGSSFPPASSSSFPPPPSSPSAQLDLHSRLIQAEEIYQRTLAQRREILAAYSDPATIPFFAATDGPSYISTPWSIWDLIPAAFNCPYEMQRVGRMGDGGKWVCGMTRLPPLKAGQSPSPAIAGAETATTAAGILPFDSLANNRQENCTIYSFGVRDESSFEEEMLQRTACKLWAYDPAVPSFGPQLSESYVRSGRASFTRAALGPRTILTQNPPSYTLKDLMQMNSHSFIDILKIDIEFAEFGSLDAFMNDFSQGGKRELPVGQILIEIHLFKDRITPSGFLNWWQRLESFGFRPVWTEPNLLYVTQHISDSMPRLSEYTLININSAASRLLMT